MPLTGGLGNQLFQFAYGLFLQEKFGCEVNFDATIGRPRKTNMEIALLNLTLESPSQVFYPKESLLDPIYRRAYGWSITKNLKRISNRGLKSQCFSLLANLLLRIKFKGFFSIHAATNLGHQLDPDLAKKNIVLGYFQTYKYGINEKVFPKLYALMPRKVNPEFCRIQKQIRSHSSLLVHVRMTDYINEVKFGIPSPLYYSKAISEISKLRYFDHIWLISDDFSAAREHLSALNNSLDFLQLDDSGLTDIEVWDLLRDFSGYVIANSTFSWWSAFLRRDGSAPVCVPNPWFRGMEEPEGLIPPSWIKINVL
jgi:hypothetical protein